MSRGPPEEWLRVKSTENIDEVIKKPGDALALRRLRVWVCDEAGFALPASPPCNPAPRSKSQIWRIDSLSCIDNTIISMKRITQLINNRITMLAHFPFAPDIAIKRQCVPLKCLISEPSWDTRDTSQRLLPTAADALWWPNLINLPKLVDTGSRR